MLRYSIVSISQSDSDLPVCQPLLTLSVFIMQQAMLKEQTGSRAGFLLVQL